MATNRRKTVYTPLCSLLILFAAVSISSSLESYSRGLFSRQPRIGTSRTTPLTPEQRSAQQEKELHDTLTLFRVKTLSELQTYHAQIKQLLTALNAHSVENAIDTVQILQQKLERTKAVVQSTKKTLSIASSKEINPEIARLQEFRTKIDALTTVK
jgi:ribosome assembly protein YihI (activator of Der GTPase)